MASLNYNGNVVNSAVSELTSINNGFSSLASSIKSATAKITSARGFDKYIGGISSDTFSSSIAECSTASDTLVQNIRQSQIKILSYSQDSDEINAFLDTLDRIDYKSLDMSGIENQISFGRKAGNFFPVLVVLYVPLD